jgi:hypothetical protein
MFRPILGHLQVASCSLGGLFMLSVLVEGKCSMRSHSFVGCAGLGGKLIADQFWLVVGIVGYSLCSRLLGRHPDVVLL